MLPTLFVSYRAIPGFTSGLHRINEGKVFVFSGGLTNNSPEEEFLQVVPEMRKSLSTGLYLPAIPRGVIYVGRLREEMKSVVRELMPRGRTRILACSCHFQEKEVFAMGHGLQITLCECDGGGATMARLIGEAKQAAA